MNDKTTYIRLFFAIFMAGLGQFAWAGIVTDVLDVEVIGARNSYGNWTGKKSISKAVYAGYSTGTLSVQLRQSYKKSGIVTTTSGGKARKISVTFHSNTNSEAERVLNIYGKNEAYTSAADLYSSTSSTKGTLLGTITYGKTTELSISGDYTHLGICVAGDYTIYLSDISIDWEDDSYQDSSGKTATTTTFPKNAYTAFLGDSFTAPTAAVSIGDAEVTYSSSDESVATVDAATGEVTMKKAGTTTITASYAGDETYAESSATYTLTVQNAGAFVWDATAIYSEKTILGTVTDGSSPVSITFAKNEADTSPAYFPDGNAVRTYYKNTIAFSVPESYVITGIEIAYVSGYGYTFTPDKGSFSVESFIGNWTGISSSITLKSTGGARFTSITVSYTRLPEVGSVSVSAAGVATFCPTTPVIVGDGTLSTIVTGVDGDGYLIQEDIEVIPARTGVMLFGTGTHKLYSCEGFTIDAPATNCLVGVTADTPAIIDTHVLQNGEDGIAFYHVKTAGITTVTAGKAYLKLDGAALAKTFRFFKDEESTSIGTVQETNQIKSIYSINGTKTDHLVKGINIILLENGKTIKFIKP